MAGYRRVDAFLVELILTIPVVIFSEMFAQLLGYLLRDFIGAAAPALPTAIVLVSGGASGREASEAR